MGGLLLQYCCSACCCCCSAAGGVCAMGLLLLLLLELCKGRWAPEVRAVQDLQLHVQSCNRMQILVVGSARASRLARWTSWARARLWSSAHRQCRHRTWAGFSVVKTVTDRETGQQYACKIMSLPPPGKTVGDNESTRADIFKEASARDPVPPCDAWASLSDSGMCSGRADCR